MNLFELFVKIDADTSQAEKGMKETQKNSETLTNKIKVMSAQFEAAQKNVDKLTQEFNESVNKTGAASKETQELAKKLSDAEKEAGKFAKELDAVQKEAEQSEKALDGCNEEIEDTGKKAEKSGNSLANFAGNSAFKSEVSVNIACEIFSFSILFFLIISDKSSRVADLISSTELFSTVIAPLIPFVIIIFLFLVLH